MGKRKIQLTKYIEEKQNRRITFLKRKKGLIKKAMELSFLCNQKVSITIYDENKKTFMIYRSSDDYNFEYQTKLCSSSSMIELYNNEDYGKIGVRRARKKARETFPHLLNVDLEADGDVTDSDDDLDQMPDDATKQGMT